MAPISMAGHMNQLALPGGTPSWRPTHHVRGRRGLPVRCTTGSDRRKHTLTLGRPMSHSVIPAFAGIQRGVGGLGILAVKPHFTPFPTFPIKGEGVSPSSPQARAKHSILTRCRKEPFVPTVTADALRRIGYEFFTAVGCRFDDARIVADHLVQSNLYGHDSHGVVHMERYGRAVRGRTSC